MRLVLFFLFLINFAKGEEINIQTENLGRNILSLVHEFNISKLQTQEIACNQSLQQYPELKSYIYSLSINANSQYINSKINLTLKKILDTYIQSTYNPSYFLMSQNYNQWYQECISKHLSLITKQPTDKKKLDMPIANKTNLKF